MLGGGSGGECGGASGGELGGEIRRGSAFPRRYFAVTSPRYFAAFGAGFFFSMTALSGTFTGGMPTGVSLPLASITGFLPSTGGGSAMG